MRLQTRMAWMVPKGGVCGSGVPQGVGVLRALEGFGCWLEGSGMYLL